MHRSRNNRPSKLIYLLATIGLVLIPVPVTAQDNASALNATITGSGTVVFRHRSNFLCNLAVLVPAGRTDVKSIPTSGTSILMDWQYNDAISSIRKMPGAVEAACDLDGAFQFSKIRSGNFILLAHFHWLRGKWSSGGWLSQEVAVYGIDRNVALHGEME